MPQFTWWSALDILIIAIMVYQFLALVRGTRAAQMVTGLGVIAILVWAARHADLKVTNWFTGHLLPYAFIVLFIIFQAELRHILARIGRSVRIGYITTSSEPYDDIVMAANHFAQQH